MADGSNFLISHSAMMEFMSQFIILVLAGGLDASTINSYDDLVLGIAALVLNQYKSWCDRPENGTYRLTQVIVKDGNSMYMVIAAAVEIAMVYYESCTSSLFYMKTMLAAMDGLPINFAFTGKGNDSGKYALQDIIRAGAVGLKLHEDWGSTPTVISNALDVGDEFDVQINIHTDTLNESGFVEDTVKAFGGRTIHTYHTEGTGGSHTPDIITVCGLENVLPSCESSMHADYLRLSKPTVDADGLPPPR
ncbi:hypothetical protein DFH29DRAFT_1024511 [Suillus ampliporus]|nr:hypothetical protein DFH29DRAFT_1024511 [Suillus ampliporus]